jgi:uncharacterized membrane protein
MASPTPGKTQLGVAPNVGGLLCYAPCCVGLIFSIVAVIVEKSSRFVRFHAFQSLLLHGAIVVVAVALQVGTIIISMISGALGMLASLFHLLAGLGFLAIAIFMMVKAYGNEELELPVIGEMARKWASS